MTNEELVTLAQQGDSIATERLLENNKGLIVTIAHKYKNLRLEYEDRESYATIFFLEAIKKYDDTRKAKFSTHAYGYMDNLMKNLFYKAKSIDCSKSLDELPATADGNCSILDIIPDEDSALQFENVLVKMTAEQITKDLRKLKESMSEKQAYVLENVILREIPIKQVADELGVTFQAVSTMKTKILKRLGNLSGKYGLV